MANEIRYRGGTRAAVGEGSISVSSLLLRRAIARLEREMAGPHSDVHAQSMEGLSFLALLADGEEAALPPIPPATDSERLRRLWDHLRAEVVRDSAGLEDLTATEILDTWAGLERVGEFFDSQDAFQAPDVVSRVQNSELLVELAHDLRSPLTSVLFLCDALRGGQSGPLTDLQRRQLGIIYSAALRLISMASDVIELAQGGERLLEREPLSFSVRGIVEALVDLVQPIAEERGLGIRTVTLTEDRRIGHPVALSRILLNLTTNALKFTEAGFVEISAQALNSTRVEFSVRDTGGGLDGETLTNLFNPLRPRVSGREYGLSGSGLGLTICQRLVRAMGAELQLETIPGWGTRFFFDLDLPPVQPD